MANMALASAASGHEVSVLTPSRPRSRSDASELTAPEATPMSNPKLNPASAGQRNEKKRSAWHPAGALVRRMSSFTFLARSRVWDGGEIIGRAGRPFVGPGGFVAPKVGDWPTQNETKLFNFFLTTT